jgi:predicted nuclease of predicted toxin-antitoxin system
MTFKVLCDVHIALKVAKFFKHKGYEAIHVNNILESYHTKDSAISDYANQHGFTVITKDIDFKDSHFIQDKPRKLLHITLGNIPTIQLIEILDKNLDNIVEHFQTDKCFVELGDGYINVIK